MHCSIGVWDPVPLFRSGLCSALGASAAEVQPESLTEWARGDGAEVAVISIVVGDDWRLIPRLLCERKDLAVVALLEWSSQAGVRQALKLGATAALPRSVGISEVVGVVGSARAGFAVIPRWSARGAPGDDEWSEEERGILEALADGESVTELACHLGYSRRTAARRLSGIYDRLGVSRACEATLAAARLGLIAGVGSQVNPV